MEKAFNCGLCSKKFSSRSELFYHTACKCKKKSSRRKQQFKCNECGKDFNRKDHMIAHMRVHTGERPYKCTVTCCGMKFKTLSNLNNHIKCKHSDERPFACNFADCKYTSKTTKNLNQHKKLKHCDDRPFACHYDGCNYRAKLKEWIRPHVKSIHSTTKSSGRYKCDYRTTRKGDLKLLIRRLHPSRREDPKCSHPECAEYLICSYDLEARNLNGSCSTSTAQDFHPSEADNQENIEPNTSPSLSKGSESNCSPDMIPAETFACAESDYKTTREDDAMSHMRYCPSAKGNFKCSHPKCNRSFKTRNQLRSHFRNRHKERIFQCDHPGCGKNFATAERLNLHKRNFHSEKRDACPNSKSSLPQSLHSDDMDGLFGNEDKDEGSVESDHLGCHPSSANLDALHARPSADQNKGNNNRMEQTGYLTNTLNESNRNANLEQSLVGPIMNGSCSSASTAQDFQTSEADHQENIEPNTIHTRPSLSKDSGSSCSPDMGPRGDANLEEPAYLRSNWFRTLLSSVELNQ